MNKDVKKIVLTPSMLVKCPNDFYKYFKVFALLSFTQQKDHTESGVCFVWDLGWFCNRQTCC